MAKILALDTSSELCSVSLFVDGELYSKSELAPRQHAQLLLPMIQSLVADQRVALKDLDAIAFGRGPGSFTGLRIAAGVTQGLAYGLDCPVVPVSNLQALALQSYRETGYEKVLVAIDARMDEVYWSECVIAESDEGVLVETFGVEHVTKPEALCLSNQTDASDVSGVGSGFAVIERMTPAIKNGLSRVDVDWHPRAEEVALIAVRKLHEGKTCSAEQAAPVYIRDEITWKKLPGKE